MFNNVNNNSLSHHCNLTIDEAGWNYGAQQEKILFSIREDLALVAGEVARDFVVYCRSKGERSHDWDARFEKWLGDERRGWRDFKAMLRE